MGTLDSIGLELAQLGLDRLGPRIHREDLFEARHLRQLLEKGPEPIVVEGPAGQGDPGGLLEKRIHDPRVTMPLVDGGIARKHVQIPVALRGLDPTTPGP